MSAHDERQVAEYVRPTPERAVQQGVLESVLARFGWTLDDEVRRQYWTNPIIYNLMNGLVALAEENDRLRRQIDGEDGAPG
jgi:hypothetical protein